MISQEVYSDVWDKRVAQCGKSQFLQSSGWAAFQKYIGRECYFFSDPTEAYTGMGILMPLVAGYSYLFFPRGPIVKNGSALEVFTQEVHAFCQKKKILFFRCEPVFCEGDVLPRNYLKTKDIHPSTSRIIDLSRDEDELRGSFHAKTRYNIGLAARRGVEVIDGVRKETVDNFIRLTKQTTARQSFSSHPSEYYEKLFQFFDNQKTSLRVHIYSAIHQNVCIASIAVISFGKMAVYLYGASDHSARDLQAPQLLQWHAMTHAKKEGCLSYDMWGVSPPNQPQHPWAGISRFKEGFGGQKISEIGTYDVPVHSFAYAVYAIIRRIRRRR